MLYSVYLESHWSRYNMSRKNAVVLRTVDRAPPDTSRCRSAPSARGHVDAVDAMKDAPALQICLVNRISTIAKPKGLKVSRNDLGRTATIESAERSTSTRFKLMYVAQTWSTSGLDRRRARCEARRCRFNRIGRAEVADDVRLRQRD